MPKMKDLCRRCDGKYPREKEHGFALCPDIKAKVCDRCLKPMDSPELHGWTICPYEPRSGGPAISDMVAQERWYKKGIEMDPTSGSVVKGADLIQPFMKDKKKGKEVVVPNPAFLERYGDKEYTPEAKQEIKELYG